MEEDKKVPFYKKPLTSTAVFLAGALLHLAIRGDIGNTIAFFFLLIGVVMLIVEVFKKKFSWYSLLALLLFFMSVSIAQGANS